MARRGWINDPNGPLFYKGKYHIFYQHLPTGVEWDWGLVWGHAISSDLVHWEHLPPAIRPTPGFCDADGCFSGCCTLDSDDVPTIMYTGVRLRSNQECGPLPPTECDLQLPFIETQLIARADPRDVRLASWQKQDAPFLALPPPNMPLTGWRDPFVIQRGDGNGRDWIILMGAGLKGEGGTTLIYRAKSLQSQWEYTGLLCMGDPSQGAMWECPLLWRITPAPQVPAGPLKGVPGGGGIRMVSNAEASSSPGAGAGASAGAGGGGLGGLGPEATGADIFSRPSHDLQTAVASGGMPASPVDENYAHFYCISPDAPTNPVFYWMGHYDADTVKFRLADALGPYRLDLGDTIYAPNIFEDKQGRGVLWAWVQERRSVGNYDFSGCMATPRIMITRNNRLIQQPLPEISLLRTGAKAHWQSTPLPANVRTPLENVGAGGAVDIEVVLRRGTSFITGIMLQSWNSSQASAAILYDWEASSLEVVFEAMDPETKTFSMSAPGARRIGGKLEPSTGDVLALRVILDNSLLEVFTGAGQVLTTRVYRGRSPKPQDPGIDFLALGGMAEVVQLSAWELGSIWRDPPQVPKPKFTDLSGLAKFDGLEVSVKRAMDKDRSAAVNSDAIAV